MVNDYDTCKHVNKCKILLLSCCSIYRLMLCTTQSIAKKSNTSRMTDTKNWHFLTRIKDCILPVTNCYNFGTSTNAVTFLHLLFTDDLFFRFSYLPVRLLQVYTKFQSSVISYSEVLYFQSSSPVVYRCRCPLCKENVLFPPLTRKFISPAASFDDCIHSSGLNCRWWYRLFVATDWFYFILGCLPIDVEVQKLVLKVYMPLFTCIWKH